MVFFTLDQSPSPPAMKNSFSVVFLLSIPFLLQNSHNFMQNYIFCIFQLKKRHIFWWKCEFYVIFTFLRHFWILIKILVAKRQFPAGWNSLKSHFEKIGLKRIVDLKTSFLWWKYKFFWWKCAFWSRSNYWYRHPRDFNVGNRVQVG